MAAIGGFRSDLSIIITRKTDGNFGNVSAGVLFSKVAYQRKRCQVEILKGRNQGFRNNPQSKIDDNLLSFVCV